MALCRRVLDAINTGASTERGGYSVIDQQQTECDREQIEVTIIPSRRDHDLQKNDKPTCKQPHSPRRPTETWNDNLDDKSERDRKARDPPRTLIGPPADHARHRR